MNRGAPAATTPAVDPITLTVVWDGLIGLCEDMGLVLQRTSHSEIVRHARDCGAAIFDPSGLNLAQGAYSPGMIGPMEHMVRWLLETFPPDELQPGDAIITNDIYMGAGQLQDTFTISPVFDDRELIGFVGTSTHLMDVGGAAPGSQLVVGVYDNFQEGLRIPPLKHVKAGVPNEDVLSLITNNVRFPDKVRGDIFAMINANNHAANRIREYIGKYGLSTMSACYREIVSRSEAAMREAISGIPDGTYSCDLQLDDSGPDTLPVPFAVDVLVAGSEITIDWTRSGPQLPAAINSTLSYTEAYSFFSIQCLLAPEVPLNSGTIRPLRVVAPQGNRMNPIPPAPGGGRAATCQRHFEAVTGALAEVVPDRAMAATSQWCNVIVGGVAPDGRPYLLWDMVLGGFGARPHSDGPSLCSVVNTRNIPCEVHESENPVLIERLEFLTDTGGAGTRRGALGLRKDIRFLGTNSRLTPLTDRHRFPPHGIAGGHPGATGALVLEPAKERLRLHSKGLHEIGLNQVLRIDLSGGGGYGPPDKRDVDSVLEDVLDGYVSVQKARQIYKVAVANGTVDRIATDALRASATESLPRDAERAT